MSENRHRTVVEITADPSQAEQQVKRLQQLFDDLAARAARIPMGGGMATGGGGIVGGGGGTIGGGGSSLTPGTGLGGAPATGGGAGAMAGAPGTGGTSLTPTGGGIGSNWSQGAGGLFVPPGTGGGSTSLTGGMTPAPSTGGVSGTVGTSGGGTQGGARSIAQAAVEGGLAPEVIGGIVGAGLAGKPMDALRNLNTWAGKATGATRMALRAAPLVAVGVEGVQAYAEQRRLEGSADITRGIDMGKNWMTRSARAALISGGAGTGAAIGSAAGGVGAIPGGFIGGAIGWGISAGIVEPLIESAYDRLKPGLQQRAEYAGKVGRFEQQTGLAKLMGTDVGRGSRLQRSAVSRGYDPYTAADMGAQFAGMRGVDWAAGGAGGTDIFAGTRAGAGLGGMAAWESLQLPGRANIKTLGAGDPKTLGMVATGQHLGLAGGGIDRWLQEIASHTKSMNEQGIIIDPASMREFATGWSQDIDVSTLGAPGMMRALRGLSQVTTETTGDFLSGFGELGNAALTEEAFGGGRSLRDATKFLQSRTPAENLEILQRRVSPDLFPEMYAAKFGTSIEEAEMVQASDPTKFAAAIAPALREQEGLEIDIATAQGEQNLLTNMNTEALIELTKKMHELKLEINELGKKGWDVMKFWD